MELREYLAKKNQRIVDFADEIGYTNIYLYKVMGYQCTIGKKLAKLLLYVTNGEVTQADIDTHNERVKNG